MVEKIDAYKCDVTGAIFEDRQRAIKSEFRARMKRVGGGLPAMGSVEPSSILDWLASKIESGIYPNVLGELQEALQYWHDNNVSL
jgi:hypothetical protein